MDWIQGDKFVQIGDYTYAPQVKIASAYDGLQNTLDVNAVKDGDIVYTHGFYVKQLFGVIKNLDKKIILVSHNSDTNIDDSFIIPPCVVKWYAQNVNTINPILHSIPIGLENNRWLPNVRKKEKMLAKLKEPRKYKNLVYMNHNISNNPAKRQSPYELLKDKPWVTTDMGKNGDRFDEYLDNIYNHKFIVCPEGNGIDTHRLWECLYMGTIPITENNVNTGFYDELPILTCNKWDDITETKLTHGFVQIKMMDWNFNMLTFEYWKNKIKDEKELLS